MKWEMLNKAKCFQESDSNSNRYNTFPHGTGIINSNWETSVKTLSLI